MKIRNVKIKADLKGCKAEFRPLFEASILDMVRVFESSHWDDAWVSVTSKFKIRLEGELNLKIKKMSNQELALLIFNNIETDENGVVWHCITDYDIDTYYTIKRVIGYGVGTDDITRVNTRYLEGRVVTSLIDKRETGENLTHEKIHDRNGSHDSKATARRPNSAGYIAGTAYEIAFDIVFKEVPVKPILVTDIIQTQPEETIPPVVITNPNPVTGKKVCRWTWRFWKGKVCTYEKVVNL